MTRQPEAVVTGAASGIGRALAEQLAADGYHLHLADITPTDHLGSKLGGLTHLLDVADADAMDALATAAPQASIVCLNAGIVGPSMGAPWEVPADEWLRLLQVNLLGPVNGLRAFVPRLLATGRPGQLLVTASLAGLVTFPGGGAYAATKHALVAVAEQAALALAQTPVSVTVVCPALVRTAMSPQGADPADVASAALTGAREGRFVVMPVEWSPAVRDRAERLASGQPPQMPTM
jgi:NAD(P)-dependent dehydrogenase (short-subunit alcohol dehydrogenase family)